MIERTVYGPVSYLAPDQRLEARLELSGVRQPNNPCTVHVFLEEVKGQSLDELKQQANYAGSFTLPDDLQQDEGGRQVLRLEITEALKKAKALRPNFYITFLVETGETAAIEKIFRFNELDIAHVVPLNTKLNISADVMIGLGKNE